MADVQIAPNSNQSRFLPYFFFASSQTAILASEPAASQMPSNPPDTGTADQEQAPVSTATVESSSIPTQSSDANMPAGEENTVDGNDTDNEGTISVFRRHNVYAYFSQMQGDNFAFLYRRTFVRLTNMYLQYSVANPHGTHFVRLSLT